MFLQVCVCPRGGGCLPQCMLECQTPPPDQTDPPPNQADPPGPGRPPPREADSSIRSTSGRYASYWNAFLFFTWSKQERNSHEYWLRGRVFIERLSHIKEQKNIDSAITKKATQRHKVAIDSPLVIWSSSINEWALHFGLALVRLFFLLFSGGNRFFYIWNHQWCRWERVTHEYLCIWLFVYTFFSSQASLYATSFYIHSQNMKLFEVLNFL